jgi:hypothetical protein
VYEITSQHKPEPTHTPQADVQLHTRDERKKNPENIKIKAPNCKERKKSKEKKNKSIKQKKIKTNQ